MRTGMTPRVQAIVLLLLVATSGALAGIVGDRLVSRRGAAPAEAGELPAMRGPWRMEARPAGRYAERLGDVLELSDGQRAAIDAIVAEEQERVRALTAEVQPRFQAAAAETRARIEDVLTPDQRERLRTLRSERMRALGRPDARWHRDSARWRDDDSARAGRLRDGARPGVDALPTDPRERRERMRERMMPQPPADSVRSDTTSRAARGGGLDREA
jgi:hypothetical protein